MKFTFYKQPDSMDCGPSCLRMIAKYYGKQYRLQTLRDKAQLGRTGVSLLGLTEAGEAIGLRTKSVRIPISTLVAHALLPCILHWDQNHFVVLYQVKRNRFYIADPGHGLRKIDAEEFYQHWVGNSEGGKAAEGIALMLETTPDFFNREDEFSLFKDHPSPATSKRRNLVAYLIPYRKLIIQLVIGLVVASILQMILPFLTQSVVDVGINTSNIHFVYIIVLGQLFLLAGRLATDFVRSWILLHISSRINISMLTDFLIKIMKLPLSFFDTKNTGDILQRMTDHQRIESFLTGSSINTMFSLINVVVFSVVLAFFNFNIFAVFGIATIFYSTWVLLFLRKRRSLDIKRFQLAAKEQNISIQLIQGMQEIKLNGVERSMRWGWERLQANLFRLNMDVLTINQWQQSGAFFINESKNIVILFLAAKSVIAGQMTLGTMLAVQYIIGQLNSPVEQMIGFVQSWQNAKISIDRLNEIHTLEDEEPANKYLLAELPLAFKRAVAGGRQWNNSYTGILAAEAGERHLPAETAPAGDLPAYVEDPEQAIILTNVSFAYPGAGNDLVLKDIDLLIPKGKTTAIVGISGSGKTTLLKLLLKFYEPQKGNIRMGDISLATISHKIWRSYCGVVMQESFIFSDTIANNIAPGIDNIDRQRLMYAVKIANIDGFINNLPMGLNTMIGAEGSGMSMGQKQRLLIARAVYRDPEFIFLDEATNSLDSNNESAIIKNLASFLKGRTVVVVAHRLSTVRHADQIIVLNKGVIAERGKHDDLVQLKGEYYMLVKNQLELGA